jgi:hypothetical protein
VRVTAWLVPAATLKGDDGEVVLPKGNPLKEILTELANPF